MHKGRNYKGFCGEHLHETEWIRLWVPVAVINLLPLSSKSILQWMPCGTGQISFKHLSFRVSTMFSTFSGEHWRGCRRKGLSCCFQRLQVVSVRTLGGAPPQPRAQDAWSINNLPASRWTWKCASMGGPVPPSAQQSVPIQPPLSLQACAWLTCTPSLWWLITCAPLHSGGLPPACPLTADLWHWLAWESQQTSLLSNSLNSSSPMRFEPQICWKDPFQVCLPWAVFLRHSFLTFSSHTLIRV